MIVILTLQLAACGGGGGGGGGSGGGSGEPAQPPPTSPQTYSISGTLSASASQSVDSDTNDPSRQVVPNDSISNAQPIPNPTTLGGYVNQAGTGAEGRSQVSGDPDDYFRVELLEGQRVTMLVADFDQADADLYLADEDGNIVDFSADTGGIESIRIPDDGTYIVNVFAFQGATNYVLAIGTPSAAPIDGASHAGIIPWQTVVSYREDGPEHARDRERIRRRIGMERRAGGMGRKRLMALRTGWQSPEQRANRLGPSAGKANMFADSELAARWETLIAIKIIRRNPQVKSAEPNYRFRALAIPDDPAFSAQWHYPLINLPSAWDTTSGREDIVVAIVDTGILSGHPDLAGQLVPGYDFVSSAGSAQDGDGIDPDPEDTGNRGTAGSSNYHGTHVSGTVAAAGDNGLGVTGVAYSSRIMPLRALGAGGEGTSYDVYQAIRFAAGLPNDSGTVPDQPASIINLSLGGGGFSASSQELFRELADRGIVVVAAAGNEASTRPQYPASYDNVISVSAVDSQARITPYSNTGDGIDVAAPGGSNGQDLNGDGYPDGVLSTSGSGDGGELSFAYTFISGTSMASPHVAGVIALMRSVNNDLSPADIDALLRNGALTDDLGPPGRDDGYGFGLINAQRAVLAALEASGQTPSEEPFLTASAASLSFSTLANELEFELRNGGTESLQLESLESSQPWLQVNGLDIGDNGLGLYRASVDRTGLEAGVYAATISARSSVNDVFIKAIMSVGSDSTASDVGVVYILLEDAETGEVVDQFAAGANSGEYRFSFQNVAAGSYQLFAGSDADNDLFICDSGEACGAWLTLEQPALLELQGDIGNIDFPIEYLVSFPGANQSTSSSEAAVTTVAKRRARKDQ